MILCWVFFFCYLYGTRLKTLGSERHKTEALITRLNFCDAYSQNISPPFTVAYLLHLNKWFCHIKYNSKKNLCTVYDIKTIIIV